MPTTTRGDLTAAALASLAAAAAALAVRLAEPYEHGAWLVAYLVLVGSLAQFLLGRGQVELLATVGGGAPSRPTRLRQLVLWNLGVVAVPAGVLADTKLLVVAGSVSPDRSGGLVPEDRARRERLADGSAGLAEAAYAALVALMAVSAVPLSQLIADSADDAAGPEPTAALSAWASEGGAG